MVGDSAKNVREAITRSLYTAGFYICFFSWLLVCVRNGGLTKLRCLNWSLDGLMFVDKINYDGGSNWVNGIEHKNHILYIYIYMVNYKKRNRDVKNNVLALANVNYE